MKFFFKIELMHDFASLYQMMNWPFILSFHQNRIHFIMSGFTNAEDSQN